MASQNALVAVGAAGRDESRPASLTQP
jgi:hypothetical protein